MDVILPEYMCFWYGEFPTNLETTIRNAEKHTFDGIVTPIANPLFSREFDNEKISEDHKVFTRPAMLVSQSRWNVNIIPKITDALDCDSSDDAVLKYSKKVLEQELKYAQHVRPYRSILVRLKNGNVLHLARIISRVINSSNIIVEVPLVDPATLKQKWMGDGGGDARRIGGSDTWTWWNNFRMACDPSIHLSVALEINATPQEFPSWSNLRRWLGEPVRSLITPSYLYVKNDLSYYVLSDDYRIVFELLKKHSLNFMIKATYIDDLDIRKFPEVVKFLTITHRVDTLRTANYDELVRACQPIRDEISNAIYSKMEDDPVKYRSYQNAISFAMLSKPQDSRVAVLIVGAGRGALVRAVINAKRLTARQCKLYLVERNENAVFHLRALKKELWPDLDIDIVLGDIRDYTPPEQIDLIVSDLLGAFGDDCLYPECIYPTQKYAKPNAIYIPSKIASYLNPVMTTLHHYKAAKQGWSIYVGSPYEVYNIAEPEPVFEFTFPSPTVDSVEYEQHKRLLFKAEQNCVLHGFIGYFECILWEGEMISILPKTFTTGLMSWSPYYFPIDIPQYVKFSDTIELNFWRCATDTKMWYEWIINRPILSTIQNCQGLWWSADKR